MSIGGKSHSQEQLNHHANQMNPNNAAHQANLDNHANQLNPNNERYQGLDRGSRGDGNYRK